MISFIQVGYKIKLPKKPIKRQVCSILMILHTRICVGSSWIISCIQIKKNSKIMKKKNIREGGPSNCLNELQKKRKERK